VDLLAYIIVVPALFLVTMLATYVPATDADEEGLRVAQPDFSELRTAPSRVCDA